MFLRMNLAMCVVMAGALTASAQVWDESANGDLSNDAASPTAVTFAEGSNVITGSVVTPDDTRDFFTFTIASDQELTEVRLLQYEDLDNGGDGNRGFHAINSGATSFVPGNDTAGDFLGGNHLDPEPSGTDLLAALATGPVAGTGFSTPLGAGTYSYVVQQTGDDFTGYSLDFIVAAAANDDDNNGNDNGDDNGNDNGDNGNDNGDDGGNMGGGFGCGAMGAVTIPAIMLLMGSMRTTRRR